MRRCIVVCDPRDDFAIVRITASLTVGGTDNCVFIIEDPGFRVDIRSTPFRLWGCLCSSQLIHTPFCFFGIGLQQCFVELMTTQNDLLQVGKACVAGKYNQTLKSSVFEL